MSNSYKKYQELLNNLKLKLSSDLNKTQIIEIKNNFINKYLSPIYDELKLASIEEKKELGKIANHFKSEINNIVNDILNKVDENLELSAHQTICDVMIESTNLNKANLTPLSIVTNDVIAYFNKMGFKIVDGDEVIHEKYNFDYLNIDKNHPARAQHDSYYVGGDYLLRTHNTAITLQQLENNNDKDIRVLCYGNVYRNDEDDMTHSHQFMQVDII
jgi:phenylalanyl-tRNA synthetase alpha chain